MPKWLRKSFVVMVTILTFGLVTPSQAFLYDNANQDRSPKRDVLEAQAEGLDLAAPEEDEESIRQRFIQTAVQEAENQSYIKFGGKIKPVIEDEFREVILPNIEKAVEETAARIPGSDLGNLEITEWPGGGNSEKIFHIVNRQSNEDVLRFHVRRDHPPQEGYWFNFHYHTSEDAFQKHHELGSIYWNKNTPPKWLS
ncbi:MULTISPECIES: YpjP family protein [Bacillaceae]|uniref:YpjP family protein n=1 Tax=Bacillus infantis TaxID=324767 RepID=A0A5D4SWS9_9BACI|nr:MULTISPECIES: YpjP family protein [Bacillus]OXT19415.1 hypothetical protein B9K06_03400 [Bacillus sp. OG2]MCK6204746.1 YpjP family protein [Bacillus infantis]MCP1159246.1 YpjP family protein [Bacillus infantis]MDW2875291.1 YpjP family protein [Bacillus infantis]TYS66662.1 hypothetical protein FZD47_04065 [Bacillus infantis]